MGPKTRRARMARRAARTEEVVARHEIRTQIQRQKSSVISISSVLDVEE
jgi:hypothetical protein